MAKQPDELDGRGFDGVPCLRCGEPDGVCADLQVGGRFYCEGCEEWFRAEDVREVREKWAAVFRWLATAPRREEEP